MTPRLLTKAEAAGLRYYRAIVARKEGLIQGHPYFFSPAVRAAFEAGAAWAKDGEKGAPDDAQ